MNNLLFKLSKHFAGSETLYFHPHIELYDIYNAEKWACPKHEKVVHLFE